MHLISYNSNSTVILFGIRHSSENGFSFIDKSAKYNSLHALQIHS